jgi:hypothetical protein
MMSVQLMGRIDLEPGDEVVATTWFRDYAIIVTKLGYIYRVVAEWR